MVVQRAACQDASAFGKSSKYCYLVLPISLPHNNKVTTRTQVRVRADRFRELMARRNETVDDVARGARVDRFNVYRLLRNEQSPTAATRKKLLAHFGVSFDDLFEFVDVPAHTPK